MQMDDMILVSIDDHMVEPPDMYENHVPDKWKDQVPKVVRNERGVDEWVFQGEKTSTPFGMAATVGWPKEEWGFNPGSYSELRPGCFDVHERVRDMDANGVLGSMNFPTMAGFNAAHVHRGGRQGARPRRAPGVQRLGDRRVGRQLPGPVHPVGHRPDVGRRSRGRRRCTGSGRRGVARSASWRRRMCRGSRASCRVTGIRCSTRSVTRTWSCRCTSEPGSRSIRRPQEAPVDHLMVLACQISAITAQDLLFGPTLRAFPDLKVALSEGGIGWIPFYFDRIDRHFENQSWLHDGDDFGGKLPSEVFREHILACYITDPSGLLLRDRIGVDLIAWECDYPHTDTTWPESPEFAWKELQDAGCADDEIHKITWENACRFFGWDPFAHTAKQDATVGALRARAADVDVTRMPRAEWKKQNEAAGLGV